MRKFDLTLKNKLGFKTTPADVTFNCTTPGVTAHPPLPILINPDNETGHSQLVKIEDAPDSIALTVTPAGGGAKPPRTLEFTDTSHCEHSFAALPPDDPLYWNVTITYITGETGYPLEVLSGTTNVTVTDDQT